MRSAFVFLMCCGFLVASHSAETYAKSRHHHVQQHYRTMNYEPGYRPWHGPDPTRGAGYAEFNRLRAQGRCVIDEGYGRYSFCDGGL